MVLTYYKNLNGKAGTSANLPAERTNISDRIEDNQAVVFVEKEIVITEEVVNPISYIILGFSIVLIIISGLIFRKAKN